MADAAVLIEAFRRDGFVHAPGLLTAEEVAHYGAAIDAAVAARKVNDHRTLDQKTPYEQSFIQCQYLWEDFPEAGALTFHPRIVELAARLIGVERLRLWHDQALYKEAGGRETEAHQDHAYWPIVEPHALTAWIALTPTDETNGCMGYVPGSHLGELDYVDIFATPGAGEALTRKHSAVAPVFVPCAAGDVIFHHGRTAHMAKPNRSGETRRVHTAIYFADGCTRAAGGAHPSVDRDAIAPGAPIAGLATPVVWPRDPGPLPVAAPWPASRKTQAYAHLGIIPGGSGA